MPTSIVLWKRSKKKGKKKKSYFTAFSLTRNKNVSFDVFTISFVIFTVSAQKFQSRAVQVQQRELQNQNLGPAQDGVALDVVIVLLLGFPVLLFDLLGHEEGGVGKLLDVRNVVVLGDVHP